MCQPLGHGIEGNYLKLNKMEQRIWNLEELEANPEFYKKLDTIWWNRFKNGSIFSEMAGKRPGFFKGGG